MANELVESKNNSSQLTPSTQDVAKKEDKKTGKLDSPNTTNAGGEVKATCPQCGQTFRRKFNMTIHIDRVETVYPSIVSFESNSINTLILSIFNEFMHLFSRYTTKLKTSNVKFVKSRLQQIQT